MLAVTFANIFAILISIIGSLDRKERTSLLLAVIFLILFYSIRTTYGNDIPMYMEIYQNVSSFSFFDLFSEKLKIDSGLRVETGWLILNWLFAPFGWQIFLLFLTIIQFGTVYWLILRYVEKKNFWLIFSIYILSSGLMLTDLSMLRQAFAMHVCCWSIPFIINRKFLKSVPFILLATTIHTSAYVSFVLLFFPYISNCNPKILVSAFVALFIVLSVLDSIVGDFFKIIFNDGTFSKYEIYMYNKENKGSGIGMLLQLMTGIWLILKYSKNKTLYFFNIAFCFNILLIPFGNTVPLVARVGMYFLLIGIISFQSLAVTFKKDFIGLTLLIANLYMAISGYFGFFASPVWHKYFAVYHTIFD